MQSKPSVINDKAEELKDKILGIENWGFIDNVQTTGGWLDAFDGESWVLINIEIKDKNDEREIRQAKALIRKNFITKAKSKKRRTKE